MPIRTHRGRAAVYRRLWGWPLRSPKHLVVALVVLAVAATGVGVLLPNPPPARARVDGKFRPETDSVPSVATSTQKSPPTFKVPQGPPAATAPNPEGLAVVDRWGRQWVNHPSGTNAQQWLDGLRPHTTDEFLTVMASVDPANVPSTVVTGPPSAVESTATSMQVRLPTNAGDVEVLVIRTPKGWRVAQYNKVS